MDVQRYHERDESKLSSVQYERIPRVKRLLPESKTDSHLSLRDALRYLQREQFDPNEVSYEGPIAYGFTLDDLRLLGTFPYEILIIGVADPVDGQKKARLSTGRAKEARLESIAPMSRLFPERMKYTEFKGVGVFEHDQTESQNSPDLLVVESDYDIHNHPNGDLQASVSDYQHSSGKLALVCAKHEVNWYSDQGRTIRDFLDEHPDFVLPSELKETDPLTKFLNPLFYERLMQAAGIEFQSGRITTDQASQLIHFLGLPSKVFDLNNSLQRHELDATLHVLGIAQGSNEGRFHMETVPPKPTTKIDAQFQDSVRLAALRMDAIDPEAHQINAQQKRERIEKGKQPKGILNRFMKRLRGDQPVKVTSLDVQQAREDAQDALQKQSELPGKLQKLSDSINASVSIPELLGYIQNTGNLFDEEKELSIRLASERLNELASALTSDLLSRIPTLGATQLESEMVNGVPVVEVNLRSESSRITVDPRLKDALVRRIEANIKKMGTPEHPFQIGQAMSGYRAEDIADKTIAVLRNRLAELQSK